MPSPMPATETSPQVYSRTAGLLYVVIVVTAMFGEFAA